VTRLTFQLVFPDRSGRMVTRSIGTVSSRSGPGRQVDAGKTLHSVRFVTGDYLDVAISFD
jgi:hypothetical protein